MTIVLRDDGLSGQVDETIESVAQLERKALTDASLQQRAIERFTLAVGRPRTVVIVLAVVASWVLLNGVLALLGRRQLDPPPYYWLQGIVSLSALLMTIVILTTENRLSETGEQRSRLNLQSTLLAERKTAKIIQLLEELRYDLPNVANREDREAEELTLPTDPHALVRELEKPHPAARRDSRGLGRRPSRRGHRRSASARPEPGEVARRRTILRSFTTRPHRKRTRCLVCYAPWPPSARPRSAPRSPPARAAPPPAAGTSPP